MSESVQRELIGALTDYQDSLANYPLLTAEQEIELAKQIEAGVYAASLLDGEVSDSAQPDWQFDSPPPTDEELTLLAEQGARAKQKLAEGNLRFVVQVAFRFAGFAQNLTPLELIQEGNKGLMRATEKFDYRRGNRFLTMAEALITKDIRSALDAQERTIRLPVEREADVRMLRKAQQSLAQINHHEPTIEELAKEMGKDPEEVNEIIGFMHDAISFDLPIGSDGESLKDFIQITVEGPDHEVAFSELWEVASEIVDPLDLELLLVVEGYARRERSRSTDVISHRRDVLLGMKGVMGMSELSDTRALCKMGDKIKKAQRVLSANVVVQKFLDQYLADRRCLIAAEL
ncbi:MAG TPA: sigma-70 domain-containing protein [Candidatus Saccharimonadales bacterium]|nr:sigma-70 domain-containing protein [Candidatus Saccharimonadales bacterium]